MVLLQLTDRQKEVYEFVQECITRNGAPPTLREIGDRFGMSSTNAVRDVLAALERKGYIKRSEYKSRGIELGEEVRAEVRMLPVVGRVAAGSPVLAVENIDEHIAVDARLLPSGDLFSLKVQGDSMYNAGIHDGDYVFVKSQKTAQPGDMVVAVIEDEATVKWYRPRKGKTYLEPDNPDYQPILVSRQAELAGKVVGMMRRFR
jgi:repressor LexA